MATIITSELVKRQGYIERPSFSGYRAERFILKYSLREEWENSIAPRIQEMQADAWPDVRQRHTIDNLASALRIGDTVGILLRNGNGEIVGFSYAIAEINFRKSSTKQFVINRDRTAHHMMIVVDKSARGTDAMQVLMQAQLRAVAEHDAYDYMVGEYNANVGEIEGRTVTNGFATHVRRHPWRNAQIVTYMPNEYSVFGDQSNIYGRQDYILFKLQKPTS